MSLSAENVTVQAGSKILVDQASLHCLPGKVVVLLGPNGAGKSTLLGALTGDANTRGRPQRRNGASSGSAPGHVSLEGQLIEHWAPGLLARRRAVLRQNTQVPFAFTAREVVEFGDIPWQKVAPRTGAGRAYEHDVMDYLSAVGLAALAGRKYPTLSGGEARRVQLARAMYQIRALESPAPPHILPARYLLLDEPLAGLDIAESSRVLGIISKLRAQQIGVICVFHDLNAAAHIADHIVLMRQGKILAQGPAAQCMTRENLVDCFQTDMDVTLNERGTPAIRAVFVH